MSTAAPASNTHASASTSAAHATTSKARHGAAQAGSGDLFANLLSLLSSTLEPATDTALGTDATAADKTETLGTQAPATDGSQNPLAALLGWSGAPGLPNATAASHSAPAGSATPADTRGIAGVGAGEATLSTAATLPGTADTFATASASTTVTAASMATTAPAASAAGTSPAQPGTASQEAAAQAAARAPQQPGVGLQGLTPLATPTAPDAATLAALNPAAGNGAASDAPRTEAPRSAPVAPEMNAVANASANASESAAAPRSLNWRSTAGTVSTASAQALHAAHHNAVGDAGTSARQAMAAQTRSTVALDERFGQSLSSQVPLAAGERGPVAAGASGTAQQDSGSGSPGAAPGQPMPEAPTDSTTGQSPDTSAYAEATGDTDDTGAAHWGTPNLRHASLRVGEGTTDAIDIQLSMAGQEVQVDFRTDNAEARASLAQDAGGSLGELLQRSGIQLGSVSVGAQHQQPGEQGRSPEQGQATTGRGRPAAASEASTPAAPVVRPRSDGSRPLDLFV